MTSHPLGNVFEAMMEKGQDQIPDEGFLMTKDKFFCMEEWGCVIRIYGMPHLTQLSTIFQLYHGCHFYWWRT
jgi:hypothetical protein